MDAVLQKVMARKRRLEEELHRIETFLSVYEEVGGEPEMSIDEDAEPAKTRNNPNEIIEAVADVIRAAGRPLMRGDIVDRVEASGIAINSADKPRYVGTLLWRNAERFPNIEGQGYGLKGEVPRVESPHQGRLEMPT